MNLFEIKESNNQDWFRVCPNADPVVIGDEALRAFDLVALFDLEVDREIVRKALKHGGGLSRSFLINTLHTTYPHNQAIIIIAREMLHKVPDSMLIDALALAHTPNGHNQIRFPTKIKKPIPSSLLQAFGLRPSESAWFNLLASNKSFIRLVASQIKPKDWKHLPHNKGTLLKTKQKKATASQQAPKGEGFLW